MEKASLILEQLAQKLNVTVEMIWGALIKQGFISGVMGIIWFAVFWVAAYLCAKWIIAIDWEKGDDPELVRGVVIIIVGVVCMIAAIGFTIDFTTSLAGIFNPEYWALKEISHLF